MWLQFSTVSTALFLYQVEKNGSSFRLKLVKFCISYSIDCNMQKLEKNISYYVRMLFFFLSGLFLSSMEIINKHHEQVSFPTVCLKKLSILHPLKVYSLIAFSWTDSQNVPFPVPSTNYVGPHFINHYESQWLLTTQKPRNSWPTDARKLILLTFNGLSSLDDW